MAKRQRKREVLVVRLGFSEDLAKVAQVSGETKAQVIERALDHYVRFHCTSHDQVRPEMMALAGQSIERNRKLLELLAK
jgi:hypothetical protein